MLKNYKSKQSKVEVFGQSLKGKLKPSEAR